MVTNYWPEEIKAIMDEVEQKRSSPSLVPVVDEKGKQLTIPDYDSFMSFLIQAATLSQVMRIRKYYDDRRSQGFVLGIPAIAVTSTRQEQSLPLKAQSVGILNSGPNPAKVWVNNLGVDPARALVGTPLNINFETHVIERLYFQCDPGQTATLEVALKY